MNRVDRLIHRLILEGSENQVEFLREMGASVADGKLTHFTLVGFSGLEQFTAKGTGFVLSVSRNAARTTAELVIQIEGFEHDSQLSTTWNAREGKPTLRFRAGTTNGNRPEQWDFVEQTDGPEFFYMIDSRAHAG